MEREQTYGFFACHSTALSIPLLPFMDPSFNAPANDPTNLFFDLLFYLFFLLVLEIGGPRG